MSVRGKRVLVTGATGGVGPHIVEALLAMGAEVVAAARRRTRLDDLRAGLQHHERLDVAECDATDSAGVAALFASMSQKAPIDAVIHAVGAFAQAPLHQSSDAQLRAMIDQNLVSAALVLRGALQHMLPRGSGSVVVLSSERALAPAPELGLYGASKAAVTHLVQACASEAGSHGLRVNAILPGHLNTIDNRARAPEADTRSWAEPEAVARAATWLASDDAAGVNGTLLRVPDN